MVSSEGFVRVRLLRSMSAAFRIHISLILAVLVCLSLSVLGGDKQHDGESRLDPICLRNVAKEAGVRFVLDNYETDEKHMIETMPGGVATLDYNNDGLLDIYFTNGAATPSMKKDDPRLFNRLYRNDGNMKFTDVTAGAGVAGDGYSMGVAAGDYDNDGFADIFVAGVYRNVLYHNKGDGTFEEVTPAAGIKSDKWSVAAGWFDYDNDGYLDLFVVNYVEWTLAWNRFCGDPTGKIRVYCHPKYFTGVSNQLYHNRGNGTFEDVSEKSGISQFVSRGMSVAFEDFDRDGRLDAFVTNDKLPNFLFKNMGDGAFKEVGLMAGAALRENGKAVSSMGVAFQDFDNDGWPDLWVTALDWETFPLFRNLHKGVFEDVTFRSKVAAATMRRSAWSLDMADFNNDGWKDMFTANAHANHRIDLWESTDYRQPNTILANRKNGTFEDVSESVGGDFQVPRAHRGSACGDFNGDGKIDLVVTAIQDETEVWENVSPNGNNWLLFKLEGTKSNRDGIGTQIRLADQYNMMATAVGYASSSDYGVHFGLGKADRIDRVELRWPSGTVQVLRDLRANQVVRVKEPR